MTKSFRGKMTEFLTCGLGAVLPTLPGPSQALSCSRAHGLAGLQARSERREKVKAIKRNYTIKHSDRSSIRGTWNAFLKCHSKPKYCDDHV